MVLCKYTFHKCYDAEQRNVNHKKDAMSEHTNSSSDAPDNKNTDSKGYWSTRPEAAMPWYRRRSTRIIGALATGAALIATSFALGARASGGDRDTDDARGPVVTSSAPNTPSASPSPEVSSSQEATPTLTEQERMKLEAEEIEKDIEAYSRLTAPEFYELPKSARNQRVKFEYIQLSNGEQHDFFSQEFADDPGVYLYDKNPVFLANENNTAREVMDMWLFKQQAYKYQEKPGTNGELDTDAALQMVDGLSSDPESEAHEFYAELVKGKKKVSQIRDSEQGSAENPVIGDETRPDVIDTLEEGVDEKTGVKFMVIAFKNQNNAYVARFEFNTTVFKSVRDGATDEYRRYEVNDWENTSIRKAEVSVK